MIGDTVFLVGVGSPAWFFAGLKTGWSYARAAKGAELPAGKAAWQAR